MGDKSTPVRPAFAQPAQEEKAKRDVQKGHQDALLKGVSMMGANSMISLLSRRTTYGEGATAVTGRTGTVTPPKASGTTRNKPEKTWSLFG